jgi:hypothetical protein
MRNERLCEVIKIDLHGISYKQLAMKMGRSVSCINGWVADRQNIPIRAAHIICILPPRKVNTDWLLYKSVIKYKPEDQGLRISQELSFQSELICNIHDLENKNLQLQIEINKLKLDKIKLEGTG